MENYSEENRIILDPSMEVEGAGNRTVADYSIEDRTVPRYTSTDFRYPDRFEQTLIRYSDFQRLYCPEQSPAVPGLAYTRFTDSSSAQMVPQGICLAGEYMLITAYDKARRSNSVIYVMSGETDGNQRLLTVLELPERNHAGGIAFDGKHIWVARSTSGYVSAISYETLKKAASCGQQSFRLKGQPVLAPGSYSGDSLLCPGRSISGAGKVCLSRSCGLQRKVCGFCDLCLSAGQAGAGYVS